VRQSSKFFKSVCLAFLHTHTHTQTQTPLMFDWWITYSYFLGKFSYSSVFVCVLTYKYRRFHQLTMCGPFKSLHLTHAHAHSLSQTVSISPLKHTHNHTYKLYLSLPFTHTHTLTHRLSPSPINANSYTQLHTHNHNLSLHEHTHSLSHTNTQTISIFPFTHKTPTHKPLKSSLSQILFALLTPASLHFFLN